MIISRGTFFIFSIFQFSRLLRGKRAKNSQKWQKKLSYSISQEPFVVCKCKMIISSGVFLIFSKLWFFRLLGGSEGKKWPKMRKNFLLCLICQEPYIIWSSFMIHLSNRIKPAGFFYKIMISPGVFLHLFLSLFFIFVNIKIPTFFVGQLQQFFLINSCFSSSSINAKQKFWGVPHLLYMWT